MKNAQGVVYSTEHGRMCPDCARPQALCQCRQQAAPPSGGVRLLLDTKGRQGKGVTVIQGLPLLPAELAQLGKQLKAACGTGGTLKDGTIELQGDHRDWVLNHLQSRGWPVKLVGGPLPPKSR